MLGNKSFESIRAYRTSYATPMNGIIINWINDRTAPASALMKQTVNRDNKTIAASCPEAGSYSLTEHAIIKQ
jgi:hypothetical protein